MSHSTLVQLVPIIDVRALRSTAAELNASGIRCELLQKVAPRMYFKDQLKRQLGQTTEICNYVLRLHDCPYDVGFLKQPDGTYRPVYDNFEGSPPHDRANYKYDSVAEVLGCDPSEVEPLEEEMVKTSGNWGYDSTDPTTVACSISKLLMGYSKYATLNQMVSEGHSLDSETVDEEGNIQLWLET